MKWPGEIPAIFVWTPLSHESSRRTPGPILRVVSFEAGRCNTRAGTETPGVMGPRVRGDDVKCCSECLQPQLLLALAERAQPQGVELDEARGVAMIVGHGTFLEGDEVLIVQRIFALAP